MASAKPPALVVQELLGQYMGPFTSKQAVLIVSRKTLSREPEAVTREQIPALLEGLGPSLRTLLGKASAEKLADQIRLESDFDRKEEVEMMTADDFDSTIGLRARRQRPIIRLLLLIPFLSGAIVACGMLMPDATAGLFYRGALVTAALLTAVSALMTSASFEKGQKLFAAWSALGIGYALAAIRHSMRLWTLLLGGGITDRAVLDTLLVLQNVLVALALWWFVRAWQTSGLAAPVSRRVQLTWIFLGIAVAIVVGGYPLIQGFQTAGTDTVLLVSTAGDMIGIALIVPLALPALAMRGGLLMHTWLALAASEVFWLLYDVWVGTKGMIGLAPHTATGIEQILRIIAVMFAFAATVAHRRSRL